MSLDQNLFTLTLTPLAEDLNVIDLIDPSGIAHYRKQRVPGSSYRAEVYDPASQALLISASAPSATTKHKTLELYNPTIIVELKYTGTMTFRWSFKWEEHEFEWKREECYMLRKPDPPVLVAVTKEPAGRIRTSTVQILDYNLNRFDIEDRKGLEIVMLTSLLTFQDTNSAQHSASTQDTSSTPLSLSTTGRRKTLENPPQLPSKPAPRTGVERIAEMQKVVNEVEVEEEGPVDDYAQYCANLIQDDAMLFITVQTSNAAQVPKVLQVVEQTKRIRHHAGLDELQQYVRYDSTPQKGPRRINLNGPSGAYAPPESLTVHLSKIPMPELQPKPSTGPSSSSQPPNQRDDKQTKAAREAEEKRRKHGENKKNRMSKPPTAGRTPSPSPFPYRLPANQPHPAQPSPSPSQLNNPGMYAAPPPASRPPNNAYSRPQAPPGPPPNSVPYGGGSVSHAPRPPNGPPGVGVNTNAFAGAMNARPAGSYNAPLGPPPPVQGQRPPGAPPAPAGFFDKFTSSWRI